MPTFIIKTHEDVEGTYRVEAATEEEARARFDGEGPLIDWTGVEQIDYMALSLDLRDIAALTEENGDA